MRRSSPLLDRRNERGQPRAIILVKIDSEGVLVQRARSSAAIPQEALELPALLAILDPDQQLPHVAPVPSLLLPIHVHARSLKLCRPTLGASPSVRTSSSSSSERSCALEPDHP